MFPDRIPLEGLPDPPVVVSPTHLILGLNTLKLSERPHSLDLHRTVAVLCLILDVLCSDPSLQVGVMMFPLLTQVCIKFFFLMFLCSLVLSAVTFYGTLVPHFMYNEILQGSSK